MNFPRSLTFALFKPAAAKPVYTDKNLGTIFQSVCIYARYQIGSYADNGLQVLEHTHWDTKCNRLYNNLKLVAFQQRRRKEDAHSISPN
jgi:hypothetical protein